MFRLCAAQSYASSIDARGSTNISGQLRRNNAFLELLFHCFDFLFQHLGALAEAVMMLNARMPLGANQPDVPAIVLLTDGAPTAGITDGIQVRIKIFYFISCVTCFLRVCVCVCV